MSVPCKRSSAVSTRLMGDGEAVLFNADTAEQQVLNGSGLWIWERLDGKRAVEDLARAMEAEFEGVSEAQASRDIQAFVEDLFHQGFLETARDEPGTRQEGPTKFPHMEDGPLTLDLSLTGRCNLKCPYCFYAHEMASRPDLPTEAWISFFSELGDLGVQSATLSGGEAFLRPDLWDLVDALMAHRMRYSLLTNGTLITETAVRALVQTKRRARLDVIQVSLDGSRAGIHDACRAPGSFEKTARGLRLLKDAGLPVTVRVTINRHNVDDLEGIARYVLDECGIPSLSTNEAVAIGAGCDNREQIGLDGLDQIKAMKALAELQQRYPGLITSQAGPLTKLAMYRDMEQARATGKTVEGWIMGRLSACGGVFSKLAVHHDGVIVPCNMLSTLELGRIGKNSLSKVWRNHPTLLSLRARRRIPMTEVPGCETCEWASFCNGSCPGLALEITGDYNHANPHDCYRRFLKETGIKSILDPGLFAET